MPFRNRKHWHLKRGVLMRRRKPMLKRIGAVLFSAVILALPMTAMAGEIVSNTPSSITIEYRDHGNGALNGVAARIYKVASVTGETVSGAVNGYDVTYTLEPQFLPFDENVGTGQRITGFSEKALNDNLIVRPGEGDNARRARWQAIAKTLENVAPTLRAAGYQMSTNGRVTFSNLTPGLYLLTATGPVVKEDDADYRYIYQPTFVMVPWYENGIWDYSRDLTFGDADPILRPKYTYERVENEYVIHKYWYNDTTQNTRPQSISVNIYRDGVLWRTVTLSAANDWTYRWTAGSQVFRVNEVSTGSNYSVSIDNKSASIVLENTYNPPPPSENPPPPEEVEPPEVLGSRRLPSYEPLEEPEVLGMRRLPQTGQLNWPVPVLATLGLMLFGIGFYRNRSNV